MAGNGVVYTGRFAPSPSGPLHFGSVISALAGFLDARSNSGTWLLRIDDVDSPRSVAGADSHIFSTVEKLGMYWDGAVTYQSNKSRYYAEAIAALQSNNTVYRCYCPRRLTRGRPYPGTCRDRPPTADGRFALRVRTDSGVARFRDRLMGQQQYRLQESSGDFIIKRADKLFSYNLAVVVDDALAGVSHVVRGADLIDTTGNQVWLHTLLGCPLPLYAHHPVITGMDGKKYSKQHGAVDVLLLADCAEILYQALVFLGQQPDASLRQAAIEDIISWGITHWDLHNVPVQLQIKSAGPL